MMWFLPDDLVDIWCVGIMFQLRVLILWANNLDGERYLTCRFLYWSTMHPHQNRKISLKIYLLMDITHWKHILRKYYRIYRWWVIMVYMFFTTIGLLLTKLFILSSLLFLWIFSSTFFPVIYVFCYSFILRIFFPIARAVIITSPKDMATGQHFKS